MAKRSDKGFSKLKALKCFDTVYHFICQGWVTAEVARYIQVEQKEYTEVTRPSLEVLLSEFRRTIPPAQLIKQRLPPVFKKAAEETRRGLDELKEYERLYHMQMERIDIDLKHERNVKKLFGTTVQEIRAARELLHDYAKLKMDLGLSKRHLGQLDIDTRIVADIATKYDSEAVTTVMDSPESRRKVLGLAERVLALVGKAGVLDDVIDVTPVVNDKESDE